MFDSILRIDPNQPATWEGKIFLSFDVDWAHDEVLADTITLVENAGCAATWFVTHDTPLLARLRENPKFTLGIHPNFNPLLAGGAVESSDTVLAALMKLVPEARVVRSHSLVQSERLVDSFHAHGLTHVSNFFVPETAAPQMPWRLWDDMVCIPHCWQDNVSMRLHHHPQPPKRDASGVRVYDFHPIHIFLNSENIARYESARGTFQHPDALLAYRNTSMNGVRNILESVMAGEHSCALLS